MTDEDINMKIVPELVMISDTDQFYANHLIKAGLRDKDTTKQRAKKAREDLELSIKKAKKTPSTKASLADADKENHPAAGEFGMAPSRRKNIFKTGYDYGMTTPVGKVEPICDSELAFEEEQLFTGICDLQNPNDQVRIDAYMGHMTDNQPSQQMRALRGGPAKVTEDGVVDLRSNVMVKDYQPVRANFKPMMPMMPAPATCLTYEQRLSALKRYQLLEAFELSEDYSETNAEEQAGLKPIEIPIAQCIDVQSNSSHDLDI